MGGLAFANVLSKSGQPITVPRLSPALYKTLCAQYQHTLETLFDRVVVPRDAPAKADHGDIDYLVEGIRPPNAKTDIWDMIRDALGASAFLLRGGSASYATPHPQIVDAYVQVDVELSVGDETPESAELFEWTRFMKGDSDLLQIIGISHRPLGLTCNDRGLHVRVEEIEPYNKKKALVFLTRDPAEMMEFYGLDIDRYQAGFADETELFDWASSGRFFSCTAFENRVEKHNDRARQAKRPMYQRFVEGYMLLHPDKGAGNVWTRQQVLHEAITVFNKQAQYDAMIQEHRIKIAEEELWKEIKMAVPVQSNSLALILKGLRRWVVFEDGRPCIASEPILEEPLIWAKSVSGENKPMVLAWVQDNWQKVKSLEKARADAAKEAAKGTQ
ncbi:hypothetical protein TW65_05523 [Stemphylium lycopersici]|uniref:Uncharacterized protein n=1 Tax=Stemphylium lycopersici TaxID=183478 RepID=A0A364MZ30_STELY|nr:hypothetical protein TW65_05523 [Stemphylium lycopersici]RAR07350.1 hypothetical protein DDE83_006532 [Stemphylium lycopersici]